MPLDAAAYLRRLGVAAPRRPDLAGLLALHRAHVERVAYEAVDVQLGRPAPFDAPAAAARVAAGDRAGYCYHQNGAFSELLRALGYDVTWHCAGIQTSEPEPPGPPLANHLALTVAGLPSAACPDGTWLVDVGMGDGLHQPLPLVAGTHRQGPFTFVLRASDVVPGGWRFDHDRALSFVGMDFGPARAVPTDFAARHAVLSRSPSSSFVRTFAVLRRDAAGVDDLVGCVLRRIDAVGHARRTLETADEWYGALADVFGLRLADVGTAERAALWARVRAAHEAWLVR
jgi:arylamine N-acetyltransferase